MAWYKDFELVKGNNSGTFVSGSKKKLVLHTTEGGSAAGAIAAYKANNSWPHFTVDPIKKIKYQHVDTGFPARALRNKAGGTETNRGGAIQIEIVGRASESHNWSQETLKWLAEEVIGPICKNEGIKLEAPLKFLGQQDGLLASEKAKQRLSYKDWESANYILGHQHVPENSHWDPGKIDIEKILSYIKDVEKSEENIMAQISEERFKALEDKVNELFTQIIGTKKGAGTEALRQLWRDTAQSAQAAEVQTRTKA